MNQLHPLSHSNETFLPIIITKQKLKPQTKKLNLLIPPVQSLPEKILYSQHHQAHLGKLEKISTLKNVHCYTNKYHAKPLRIVCNFFQQLWLSVEMDLFLQKSSHCLYKHLYQNSIFSFLSYRVSSHPREHLHSEPLGLEDQRFSH